MWILFMVIWLSTGALTARLMFYDWKATWPNSYHDHWNYLGFLYAFNLIVWPVFLIAMLIQGDLTNGWPLFKKDIKKYFGFIGKWFKENIDWKW